MIDSQRRKPSQVMAPVKTEEQVLNTEKHDSTETSEATDTSGNETSSAPHVVDHWRLLSTVEAWPQSNFWSPQLVDYTHNNGAAVKDCVDLINASKTDLMWNHSVDAKDVAGYITNASWEDSKDIPPGVNADLVVDPEFDKKAFVGLKNRTIRKGSIGVSMELTPSHPDMPMHKFLELQGADYEGEKVRWLAVSTKAVRHMAMVAAGTGADPNSGTRKADNISHSKTEKNGNMDKLLILLSNACKTLGMDVVLADAKDISEPLIESFKTKLEASMKTSERFNDISVALNRIAPFVMKEGETELSLEKVIERVSSAIPLVENGRKYLDFQRGEALKWFDAAKADPEKEKLPESLQRLRNRISQIEDVDYLQDLIDEYKPVAEARFGSSKRTSEDGKLPDAKSEVRVEGHNIDIVESAKRMFG